MSDVDREWTIEHAGEQLHDIHQLARHDEKSVKMWGPTPNWWNRNRRETSETPEAGTRIGRLSRQRDSV